MEIEIRKADGTVLIYETVGNYTTLGLVERYKEEKKVKSVSAGDLSVWAKEQGHYKLVSETKPDDIKP